MGRRITQEDYITECKNVHGNRYDYSKTTYIKARSRLTIICRVHGEITVHAHKHMKGSNCPSCSSIARGRKIKDTFDTVVAKANRVHNNKYSYPVQKYINTKTPAIISCPIHGEFSQRFDSHVNAGHGCPSCSRIKDLEDINMLDLKEYYKSFGSLGHHILEIQKLYKGLFTFDNLAISTAADTTQEIICKKHGIFYQSLTELKRGIGCIGCQKENHRIKYQERFIALANKLHGNKYSYESTEYITAHTKVTITCSNHGDFSQSPNSHLSGNGCPRCGNEAISTKGNTLLNKAIKYRDSNKDTMSLEDNNLYVFVFNKDGVNHCKVGVSLYPTKRFKKIVNNFDGGCIYEVFKLNSYKAYSIEYEIHEILNHRRSFKTLDKKFDGFTEVFKLNNEEVENLIEYIRYKINYE